MTTENRAGAPAALIDVHSHFVTPEYIEAATRAGRITDGMPAWPSWSTGAHLDLMDELGIERSILSVSSPGIHFGDDDQARTLARTMNDLAARICEENPTRFGFFASVALPDVDEALAEARRALDELGAEGVVLLTNVGGQYLGDPYMEPFLAELDSRGSVVFIHPTSPLNWGDVSLGRPRPMLEFMFDTTRAVSNLILNGVLERYPDLQFIVPHSGAALPILADRIEGFRPLLGDTATPGEHVRTQLSTLWFDTAGFPLPSQLPALTRAVGEGRVLFGSDFCFTQAQGVRNQVASLDAARPEGSDSWRETLRANYHEFTHRH
jgi:predicted TIM-barrel fold metal-dependent hydrolase